MYGEVKIMKKLLPILLVGLLVLSGLGAVALPSKNTISYVQGNDEVGAIPYELLMPIYIYGTTPTLNQVKVTSILDQTINKLDELENDLANWLTMEEVEQYLDELAGLRNEIETKMVIAKGEYRGELLPEARPIQVELSAEIEWLNWVHKQMLTPENELDEKSSKIGGELGDGLGDIYRYPSLGDQQVKKNVGWFGSADTSPTFVSPNPSGPGLAGSYISTFFNAGGWSYTQLYSRFIWTSSSQSKDIYFKGWYKGEIFGSYPWPFGNSWAKVSVEYFIIEHNTNKVKRVTFYTAERQNGFWYYISDTYNKPEYNYYLRRSYMYSMGVKLTAQADAWITSAYSNFAKDNDQHNWICKWSLEYIRLHS